jgi:hypothetical protein
MFKAIGVDILVPDAGDIDLASVMAETEDDAHAALSEYLQTPDMTEKMIAWKHNKERVEKITPSTLSSLWWLTFIEKAQYLKEHDKINNGA